MVEARHSILQARCRREKDSWENRAKYQENWREADRSYCHPPWTQLWNRTGSGTTGCSTSGRAATEECEIYRAERRDEPKSKPGCLGERRSEHEIVHREHCSKLVSEDYSLPEVVVMKHQPIGKIR